jgi:phosphopantetheinyl transferase (holo-ACP synthase)
MTFLTLTVDWTGGEDRFDLLGHRERLAARRLPPWRQREWTLGRLTAHTALVTGRGATAVDYEVLPDPDGAPIAYEPDRSGRLARSRWSLSLSHTGSLAACTLSSRPMPVGVDIERIDERNVRLLRRIVAAGEEHPPDHLATQLWACKEAAFKACRGTPSRLADYQVRLNAGQTPVIVPAGPERPHPHPLRAWVRTVGTAVLATVSTSARPPIHLDLTADHAIAALERARAADLGSAAMPTQPLDPARSRATTRSGRDG